MINVLTRPRYLSAFRHIRCQTRCVSVTTNRFAASAEAERRYPLRRPPNHKPPVERWTLKLPEKVKNIYTLYVGVQSHQNDVKQTQDLQDSIQTWLNTAEAAPSVVDTFRVTHGFDVLDSKVWVAYWTNNNDFEAKVKQLNLINLWNEQGSGKDSIGLWSEHFVTPIERLETNYARLDHQPGVARLPDGEFPSHNLTAYWGAGRDRLPAAATDLFNPPKDQAVTETPSPSPAGLGEHLTGTNYDNMCHIRSGQWWELCPKDEREAYEGNLQIKLMEGMQYLWDNPKETGTIGLRFLQNLNDQGEPIKETCGAGFHRNWAELEKWSSTHPSHLAIFMGAMKHAQKFGEDRKFMTWHEVSILKEGEARFEYVNCAPETGVIKWVKMERQKL